MLARAPVMSTPEGALVLRLKAADLGRRCLESGLDAWFKDSDGVQHGAYYVYVARLES